MLLSSTNHLICYFSFLHVIFMIITARQIHIIIRDNVTQACPSQHSELIDRKTISVQFELMPLAGDADQLLITGQNGNRQTITFPGCFRARLNFQLKKLINNPYIESFIQFGTNIPCKVEEDEVTSNVKRICTNITEKNWCPQSDNQKLRSMLNGKSTWYCSTCLSYNDPRVLAIWSSKHSKFRYFIDLYAIITTITRKKPSLQWKIRRILELFKAGCFNCSGSYHGSTTRKSN
uniref:Bm3040, isoform c n=1 Tax=Brugia malayi TaxID=6279 RepID=A0A5S6PJ94_BRUMA